MSVRNVIDRIRLPFRKNRELYSSFYKILGFYPHDIRPYELSLHHKSSSIRKPGGQINNERLEFLGDAVLDAVVGDIVFRHFEGKKEGFLTDTRSKIVKRETLNRLAVEIGLDKLVISSTQSPTHNSHVCGNAFEALVGAVYLDRGYSYCMRFIGKRIMARLIDIDKLAYKEVNFKSKLLEWGQKRRAEISFKLVRQGMEGSTTPVFTTQITIEGVTCGKGSGYSKKESQQMAAKRTLSLLRKSPGTVDKILSAKRQAEDLPAAPDAQDDGRHDKTAEPEPGCQFPAPENPRPGKADG